MNHKWTSISAKIDRTSEVTEGTLALPDTLKTWTEHGVLAVRWSDKGDAVAAQLRPEIRYGPSYRSCPTPTTVASLRSTTTARSRSARSPCASRLGARANERRCRGSPSSPRRSRSSRSSRTARRMATASRPRSTTPCNRSAERSSAIIAQPAAVRRATRKTGDQLKAATSALSQAQEHQLATIQPLLRQATSAVQRARLERQALDAGRHRRARRRDGSSLAGRCRAASPFDRHGAEGRISSPDRARRAHHRRRRGHPRRPHAVNPDIAGHLSRATIRHPCHRSDIGSAL